MSEMPVDVLVVDDEQVILDLFSRVLGIKGYRVATAKDGREAVDKMKEKPSDIVFLDVVLPGMDGVETLKAIRKVSPKTAVVMMTGFSVEAKIEECLKSGACECLYKPFDIVEIMRAIEKALAKKESGKRLGFKKKIRG